ncbi:hypothetical protein LTS10_010582 [Elasticomyces elasticus]|nr:hypothetical protein LTS10_010582 [Elasticomyces elasticus]
MSGSLPLQDDVASSDNSLQETLALRPAPSVVVAAAAGPASVYAQNYLEAVEAFEAEQFDRCLSVIRYNLTDPTLPRYYQIKNLMLYVAAEDNWYPAERRRLEAERIFLTATRLTQPGEEAESVLQALRSDLDELAKTQAEQAPEEVEEERLGPDWDSDAEGEEEGEDWDDGEFDGENDQDTSVEGSQSVPADKLGADGAGYDPAYIRSSIFDLGHRSAAHQSLHDEEKKEEEEKKDAQVLAIMPPPGKNELEGASAESTTESTDTTRAPQPKVPGYMAMTRSASQRKRKGGEGRGRSSNLFFTK